MRMITQSRGSLLSLLVRHKTIPVVSNRAQFSTFFASSPVQLVLLRHCNLFELAGSLEQAHRWGVAVYVNADHMIGIAPDVVGLRYLLEQFHVAGIVSNHPKVLAQAKSLGLETIQRLFAVDSTGLEVALESIDRDVVDLLDISPALVIPHLVPYLADPFPLPFIGSGLVQSARQKEAILRAGASGVAVARSELW